MLLFPVLLLVVDAGLKTWILKEPPRDGMADLALGALTFNGVHLMTVLGGVNLTAPVLFMIVGSPIVWFFCLLVSEKLVTRWRLGVSYVVGVMWFAWSTSMMLYLAGP